MDSRSARQLVEKCFPEIRVKRSRQLITGWENLVLEINGEYVFRFPKFSETEKRLRFEIELLSRIRERLSTPVPDYRFVWKGDRSHPQWSGGYPKLNGVPISNGKLERESRQQLAQQISRFLGELGKVRIRLDTLPIPVFSRRKWLGHVRREHDKIRRIAYPSLDRILRIRSEILWESLLADFAATDFKPTLIHGDLGTENILFNPATRRLTGILDWATPKLAIRPSNSRTC